MTLTIDLTPAEEVRLAVVARREGLNPTEAARRVLTANLPPVADREREQRLLEERGALLDQEDAGTLPDAQAARLRQIEAQLDRLEDQDPVEQEADRRLGQTDDKLDEILALLWSLPRQDPEKDSEDAARAVLTEPTEFRLPPEQWEAFCRRLDMPPQNIPALSRLFAEPEPFDA